MLSHMLGQRMTSTPPPKKTQTRISRRHFVTRSGHGTHAALCGKLSAAGNDQAAWPSEDTPRRAGGAYAVAQGVGTRDIQPACCSVLVVARVAVLGGGATSDCEVPWIWPAIEWQVKCPAGTINTAHAGGSASLNPRGAFALLPGFSMLAMHMHMHN
jgi:hypothetical protein